jgi:hypothetical protein
MLEGGTTVPAADVVTEIGSVGIPYDRGSRMGVASAASWSPACSLSAVEATPKGGELLAHPPTAVSPRRARIDIHIPGSRSRRSQPF